MAEAQRLQQADVSGKQFEFTTREARETAQMDRLSAQISGAEARQAQANADKTRAITGAVGGLVSTVGNMYSAGAFKGSNTTPTPSVNSSTTVDYNEAIDVANASGNINPLTGDAVTLAPRRTN